MGIQPGTAESVPKFVQSNAWQRLWEFLDRESPRLLRSLEVYVLRFGLATPSTSEEWALEIMGRTVLEALQHAGRFDALRSPEAWVRGIALNCLCRERQEAARRSRREVPVSDLQSGGSEASEHELMERLTASKEADPAGILQARESLRELLALVGPEDQQVLEMSFVQELSGPEMGEALGITPGAARTRVCRALARLRAALEVSRSTQDE